MKTNKPSDIMKMLTCLKRSTIHRAVVCFLTLAATPAWAANDTWVGSTDNAFGTTANWTYSSGSGPVAAGDLLYFGVAGSAGASLTNNLTAGLSIAGITFNSGASGFTLTGNPIVLAGGITNSSTAAQTIGFAITNTTGGRALVTTAGGGNVILNGGLYGTGGSFSIWGGGKVTIGGSANTQTGTTTVTNAMVILAADNALPKAQISLLGSVATGGSPGSLDLNGFSQVFLGGTPVVGTDANNTTQTGAYITNSSATLATVTITNYGNNFQFREGNWGGKIKIVLSANNLNNTQSGRPGSAFQMQVPGNTYSGGTVVSGPWNNPLTVTNLNSATGFATTGNTNTAILRNWNNGLGYSVLGSGSLTLDNGELWVTSVFTYTNPVVVTARGGILNCEQNQFYSDSATVTGTGLLALASNGGKTYNFSNDWSGFTGTLAIDANTTSVNLNSNSPSGDLLFWGAASAGRGILQWNGDSSQPAMLSFTRVNCGSASGVVGGTTAVGTLSCANGTVLTYRLGDNTATTNTFGGIVQNGGGTVGITKIGSDTQILAGANTYTGPTLVGGGTLNLSGVNDGSGGCVVSNGALLSFGGTGSLVGSGTVEVLAGGKLASGGSTINGLVTLSPGNAAINLQDNVINTNTIAGGLTLDSGNVLSFDLGSASDVIAMVGGSFTKNPGTVTVNISGVGFSAGTYALITGASISSTNGFALGIIPASPTYVYALDAVAGDLVLVVAINPANTPPANAFWKGAKDNNWSTLDGGGLFNWATNASGSPSTFAKPGALTAVTFSAAGAANQNTVLGGNFEIASLALTTSGNVGIGGNNSLQLDAGGLTVNSGAGNLTISNTSLLLGGAQLWTNNSANTVTVSAPIGGLSTLTLGGGKNLWSGANTHSGTSVTAGKLTVTGAGTLGSSSAAVSAVGGTIDLDGTSQTVGPVSVLGGVITNGAITGSSYSLESGMVAAILGGGPSVQAGKNSSDLIILSADNTFSGALSITNGTVQIGAGGPTGNLNESQLYVESGASVVFNTSGSKTNNGLFSGAGTLTVTGGGSLRLLNVNSTLSGDITVDGATLMSGSGANNQNPTYGVLGNPSGLLGTRNIFLNNGATLGLYGGNTLGGWASTRCGVVLYVNPGSQLICNANDSNPLGEVHLNGATMLTGNGWSSQNQAATFLQYVYVEGTNSSTIAQLAGTDTTKNGVHLGQGNLDLMTLDPANNPVRFVVNSTGATNADLIVGVSLLDPPYSGSLGSTFNLTANGGVYKDGSGTMLLTNVNQYTAATLVTAGKLLVSSVQGTTGMTNYVKVSDSAALGVVVSGTSQWSPITATMGTGGNTALEFSGITSTTVAPFNPGLFSVSGNLTINITSPIYGVGTYPLVNNWDNSGSITLGALPSGNMATLDTSTATIKLVVTTALPNPTPVPINSSLSGSTLTLSWPLDHKGWTLQSNSVSLAQPAQWFPVPGSTTVTNVAITINPSKTNVFYRLSLP